MSILIDSGITHSFIDQKLISELKCKVEPTKPVTVTVASGDELKNTAVCNPLTWAVQGMECQIQLRLGGSVMVLEVDWLSQFNPVMFKFKQSIIRISYEGMEAVLRSEHMNEEFLMIEGGQMKNGFTDNPMELWPNSSSE